LGADTRYGAIVSFAPDALTESMLDFLSARHLATLTTIRPDGSPHVVPVGFTYVHDERRIRIVTGAHSRKARNAAAGSTALVCQFDGGRWLTLEGRCEVRVDDESAERCGRLYEARYGHPPRRPGWASLEIVVDRCFGRV
jgi:PPOX class probable F420-dependent enzyme